MYLCLMVSLAILVCVQPYDWDGDAERFFQMGETLSNQFEANLASICKPVGIIIIQAGRFHQILQTLGHASSYTKRAKKNSGPVRLSQVYELS